METSWSLTLMTSPTSAALEPSSEKGRSTQFDCLMCTLSLMKDSRSVPAIPLWSTVSTTLENSLSISTSTDASFSGSRDFLLQHSGIPQSATSEKLSRLRPSPASAPSSL